MHTMTNLMKVQKSGKEPRTPLDALRREQRNSWIILIAILASITMMFASFSSAFIDRIIEGGLAHIEMPRVLWISTAFILVSSLFVEKARAAARAFQWKQARMHVLLTTVLGLCFVVSQYLAWGHLQAAGVYMSSNPHSSFFYLLTVLHVFHVLGGIIWLFVTLWRVMRIRPALRVIPQPDPAVADLSAAEEREIRLRNSVSVCATYWHYVGVLWLYLFVMLFFI